MPWLQASRVGLLSERWRGESQVKAMPQIFLCYARQDRAEVENLYRRLSDAGFKPWMDKKDILPGERWQSRIPKAIRRSDFFLACLSAKSVDKRGFLQKEIRDALDIWREMLDSDIYLIPVRLEDCGMPESLRGFQWVNLFEKDGWTRLVKAIRVGMERRVEQQIEHLEQDKKDLEKELTKDAERERVQQKADMIRDYQRDIAGLRKDKARLAEEGERFRELARGLFWSFWSRSETDKAIVRECLKRHRMEHCEKIWFSMEIDDRSKNSEE
jgi:hypothetical protein